MGDVDQTTGNIKYLSLAEIADEFKVDKSNLHHHVKKENWEAERKTYETQRNKEITAKLKEIDLPSLVEGRAKMFGVSWNTIAAYQEQLKDGDVKVKPIEVIPHQRFIIETLEKVHGIEDEGKIILKLPDGWYEKL